MLPRLSHLQNDPASLDLMQIYLFFKGSEYQQKKMEAPSHATIGKSVAPGANQNLELTR